MPTLTVTKMLQRLQRSGFVSHKPSPADRRTVLVSTTRAGEALRRQVEQAWRTLEARTHAGLTDEDCAAVMQLLGRIDGNLTRDLSGTDVAEALPKQPTE